MSPRDFQPGEIGTYTGRAVRPLSMTTDDLSLTDIAHALSNLCRFTGHTRKFYSVAEHCVRCYDVATEHKLWVLLHDASEAYVNDIARPLKHSDAYTAYREAEDHIMMVVAQKFELPWPMPDSVKDIDRRLLVTEIRDLMWGDKEFDGIIDPLPETIVPLAPEVAEQAFIYRLAMEGILLDEDNQSIEDFMKDLEDRHRDDFNDEESGGIGVRNRPKDPKPFYGDALPEPEEYVFELDGKEISHNSLELIGS